MARRFFICLVAFILSLPGSSSAADESASVTLGQLQDMAANWRAKFANMQLVYELYSLPNVTEELLAQSVPTDESALSKFFESEWIWTDHGLYLFGRRSFYWTPGSKGVRNIDIFNGPKNLSMRLHYQRPPNEPEKMKELYIHLVSSDKPTSSLMVSPMHGLYYPPTCEWLADVLHNYSWTLEGVESFLGNTCAKIRRERAYDTEWLWLDLQHGGIPRRRLQQAASGSRCDFVTDELQELPDGLWFPERSRVQLYHPQETQNQLVVVTKVEVNCAIDLSRFEPPTPEDGTVVTDGRRGMMNYIQGQQSQPISPESPLSGVVTDASFASRGRWIPWLTGLSIAFLAIGVLFRTRRLWR